MVINQTSDVIVWQKLKNFPNYEINELGQVRSLKRKNIKLLKPNLDKDGYYMLYLRKNNKTFAVKLHRLVLIQYKENVENKETVNHINGNKSDNKLTNLEWSTRSENSKHAFDTNLNIPYKRQINQYDLNNQFIKTWTSIKEASSCLNIKESNISNCCRKVKYFKTAGGFKWEYYDTRRK
jgi:hypothetical protein